MLTSSAFSGIKKKLAEVKKQHKSDMGELSDDFQHGNKLITQGKTEMFVWASILFLMVMCVVQERNIVRNSSSLPTAIQWINIWRRALSSPGNTIQSITERNNLEDKVTNTCLTISISGIFEHQWLNFIFNHAHWRSYKI